MKKNRDADALAARLAAAANQPPVLVAFPRPSLPQPEVSPSDAPPSVEPEAKPDLPADEPRRKKARRARPGRAASAELDDDWMTTRSP